MNTDINTNGDIRPLSASELDAVAGGWYNNGWITCNDGKQMWVGNFHLPGGGIIITSRKEGEKGVTTTVVGPT